MNDIQSAPLLLKYGVAQGYVLGPILFTMYSQPPSSVIQTGLKAPTNWLTDYYLTDCYSAIRHCLSLFFADDSHLYVSVFCTLHFPNLVRDTASCVDEMGHCMKANKLKWTIIQLSSFPYGQSQSLSRSVPTRWSLWDCFFWISTETWGILGRVSFNGSADESVIQSSYSLVESVTSALSSQLMLQINWL